MNLLVKISFVQLLKEEAVIVYVYNNNLGGIGKAKMTAMNIIQPKYFDIKTRQLKDIID